MSGLSISSRAVRDQNSHESRGNTINHKRYELASLIRLGLWKRRSSYFTVKACWTTICAFESL